MTPFRLRKILSKHASDQLYSWSALGWLCRPVQDAPDAAAEVGGGVATGLAAPAAAKDPATQPIWSPGTPEYIPQYTCQSSGNDKDVEGEMLHDSSSKQSAPGNDLTVSNAGAQDAKPVHGYGSPSLAPSAFRRTGR